MVETGVTETRTWYDTITPRAGVGVQLVSGAALWLVATGILVVRGVLFIERPGSPFSVWILPIAAVAIALGAVKARLILLPYAGRAVARIEGRGRACYFGFFAPKSWLFVAGMMGGGMWLRSTALVDHWWGRVGLATLYLAVGTALALADRVFWAAVVRRGRRPVSNRRPIS